MDMEKESSSTETQTEAVRVNGSLAQATLTGGELQWLAGKRAEQQHCLDLAREVLAIELKEKTITLKSFVKSPAKSFYSKNVGKRILKDFVMDMDSTESAARWARTISDCVDSPDRPKQLYIIVNPFGGKKCGVNIFNSEVKPLLEASGVNFTMQETKYRLHAKEIAYSLDLTKYDAIVCVSGDGVLVEVLNGLLQREDWEKAIKIPLGVIPAGTGNGMAKSLLHSVGEFYSATNATLAIIKGHRRSLDVASVIQGDKRFFSVLLLTWGLVADIDIESEKYRWMGSARFDFYALVRIMDLRKYNGSVQFVPALRYEKYGQPVINQPEGQGNGADKSEPHGYPGAPTDFGSCEWRSIDGPFVSVWVNNVPWAAEDIMAAPEAKFSDGYLDLVLARDCPKPALLSMLLKMSDGSYIKSPYITYLKVKAFRLEPGMRVAEPTKGGILDMDGEVIARGDVTLSHDSYQKEFSDQLMSYGPPILMTVDQGLATIFSPKCFYG